MAAVPEYFGSPDASSFPSGGLRATFEARGYPEHYVAYFVTAWPDYADGGQYITQIDITDPAVTLYGLTAGSSFEEFDAVFRGMGYALRTSDDGFTVTHTAAKNGVSFIFQAGRGGGPVLTVSAGQVYWNGLNRERLGSFPCRLTGRDSRAFAAYGTDEVAERHRHRYEFNNDFREALIAAGLRLSGLSPDGTLVEMVELAGHPWFVGVRFHPELRSRPNRAHPLFREFVAAAAEHRS